MKSDFNVFYTEILSSWKVASDSLALDLYIWKYLLSHQYFLMVKRNFRSIYIAKPSNKLKT